VLVKVIKGLGCEFFIPRLTTTPANFFRHCLPSPSSDVLRADICAAIKFPKARKN
jgi:hypothetical protein